MKQTALNKGFEDSKKAFIVSITA